jgi:hypothetical protein
MKAASETRPVNLSVARVLAKPTVSELAFSPTRHIWQYNCSVFEASNDRPHYKMNYFVSKKWRLMVHLYFHIQMFADLEMKI